MSSQLSPALNPLPTPVMGTTAATSATTVAPPQASDEQKIAALQQAIAVVNQLISIMSAQQGAAGVQGGGGTATLNPGTDIIGGGTVNITSNAGIIGASLIGGGFTSSPMIDSASAGVIGGGVSAGGPITISPAVDGPVTGGGGVVPISTAIQPQVGTPISTAVQPTIGGGADGAPLPDFGSAGVIGGGSAAVSSPTLSSSFGTAATAGAAAAPAAPAAPQIDMQRVLGTPQPGGVIDTILRTASANAPDALSEGNYIEITDAAGTRMQVHVHGNWQYYPERIADGLAQGYLAPHVHPDGTVHVHDVRA